MKWLPKVKMHAVSKQLLGWGSVLSALVYSVGLWIGMDISFIPAGLVLVILGAVLYIETIYERTTPVSLSLDGIVAVMIAMTAIVVGGTRMLGIILPTTVTGIEAYLYLVVAAITAIEIYR